MSETIQASESKRTENYAVYDSPDGDEAQEMVGTYITDDVADQLGEFIEVEISEEGDNLTVTLDKTTSNFGVYSSEADAIETMYVAHPVLEALGGESGEDGFEAPESLDVAARSSSEEAFEAALEEQTVSEDETEQEASALVADDADESDEAEALTDESDEEEAEVPDEEIGIDA